MAKIAALGGNGINISQYEVATSKSACLSASGAREQVDPFAAATHLNLRRGK